jgi:hypothetical protein
MKLLSKAFLSILAALVVGGTVFAYTGAPSNILVEGDLVTNEAFGWISNPTDISLLDSIGDVTITSGHAGDILYYNGTAWVNLASGTAGQILEISAAGIPEWDTDDSGTFSGQLGMVSDVSTSTLATGHVLYYDGSNWQDIATSSLGITASGALLLSDWYATTTHSSISSLPALTGFIPSATTSLPLVTSAGALETVGTITTGTWNGTAISAVKGGTGLTTFSGGSLLYASALNTWAALASSTDNYYLAMGADGLPVWQALDGEDIAADTIDDDSIDFADVTCADVTMSDCGAITSSGAITGDSVVANLFDVTGAADMDYGSADVTDHSFTTDDCTFIIDGGITISTGDNITLGSTQWNSGDSIDGEQIAADTIDDDSVDFGDITCVDLTMTDCGNITSVYSLNFGGAMDFEIPNAAATSTDTAGEIVIDTTSDQLKFYGGAERVIPYWQEKCFTVASTTFNIYDNIPLWHPAKAVTITDVYCETDGGTSVAMTLSDGTNALEAITCDDDGAADDGSIANGTLVADERFEVDFGTVTGAVDWINVCITYNITAD